VGSRKIAHFFYVWYNNAMALPAGIAAILANSPRAVQVLQGLGVLTGGTIAATEAQKQLQDLPEGSLEEAYKRVFLGPGYELSNLDVFKTKTPEAEDTTLKDCDLNTIRT